MRQIAVIDAETDPFRKGRVPKPFLWGFFNGKEYRQFRTTRALARFLGERDYICYAHNGGKFDFHYLLPYLSAYDDIMIINGRIAKMMIGRCELRDSVCILPVALAAYQKDDIDYAIFEAGEREKAANARKISAYLESDCRYLYQMVTAFNARFGDNLTQAGAAMKQWQKICKREQIPEADRTDRAFYERFYPYYYGGRVECFRKGIIDTRFAVYDINSAYPFAMLQSHPYSAAYTSYAGFADDCDFYRLRCVSEGALPYRGEGSGLTFPRDNCEREYTVTSWEYIAALETRAITRVSVLESIRFARREHFRDYIMPYWEERKEAKANGDKLTDIFCKLAMNSLYGKWASNPGEYRNYVVVPPKAAHLLAVDKSAYAFAGELGPWVLGAKPLDEANARYYNVATGASITGFVRAMLWRAIHSSKGVIYVDTDSIACERRGGAVRLGDALGVWKHEGDFDRAGIGGKKLYIFRGIIPRGCLSSPAPRGRIYKTASKGVRLTNAELWRVARGEAVEYKSMTPTYSVHKPPTFVNRTVKGT